MRNSSIWGIRLGRAGWAYGREAQVIALTLLLATIDYEALVGLALGCFVLVLNGRYILPGFRDPSGSIEPPSWWALSSSAWRAFDRTLTPAVIMFAAGIPFLALEAFDPSGTAIGITKATLAILFLAALLLGLLTAVFAWPAFLVPHRYRGRPSLWDEWGQESPY
jgi:hypothetical protein